ncbi:TraR/DksA family transcriptional regulator [Shimia ponticola]|uniref:TraR/DksA family transcriptional regulator n=1 Tax=Shimia ponticola TaxID=2582893 RepID=UPI0011BF011D|nr:TraR/DksA family transcriptional regulator [Shimia ponticola]
MIDMTAAKTRIQTRIAQLDTRLHVIEHELDTPKSKDWEDQAVEREGDEVIEQLGLQGETEIRLLQQALKRIDDGSYGVCEKCGEEILPERLDAVPYAALCRTCAGAGPH